MMLANGYYTQYFEQKNLRVIAFNTEAGDPLDFELFQDPTDPGGFIEFLYNVLLEAEKNDENVFLLAHIPVTMELVEWSTRFNAIVDRFSYIIRGQFYGHTHAENIHIHRSYIDDTPVGIQWVQASLTTFFIKHPSFRIFTFDEDTSIPLNYDEYRLNMTYWNS